MLGFDRARSFVAAKGTRSDRLFLETVLGDRDVGALASVIGSGQDERGAVRVPSGKGVGDPWTDLERTVAALPGRRAYGAPRSEGCESVALSAPELSERVRKAG